MTTPPTPHRNQQLFSDYYLNEILPTRADWRALEAEAQPVMAQLAQLFTDYAPSDIEAQVEEEWIRPVLKLLAHDFEVQPALETPDGTKKPDYVFYQNKASLVARKKKTLTDALPRQGGIAVGDAKYWDRPLDMAAKAKGGDTFNNKNPSYQIAFYVQHSGVDWGILTNGRLWRLYHKDTAHKLDRFYEVDLPALLATGDAGAFLYFYGFFRRGAFDAGALGLSALLHASEDYARGVGESLKKQVYDALLHLSQGFLDYAPNGLGLDAGTLKEIYDSALILLYRLLFILYAESRELLPVRASAQYRDFYGLHAIKQEVASALGQGKSLLAGSATLWPRLKTLFGYIDKGEPPLKVATFNGGLFDPERHAFLENYTVGDGHLQAAIDCLARVGGQFVDYRDLSVRHLGTIYEGLLEYHLQGVGPPAPNNGGVGGGTHHLASQGPPETGGLGGDTAGAGWTVALLNDKGERKATGSYYTPDYIVKYIVEQAVGPMLRAAVAGRDTDAGKVGAVLGVNVLDPAMGSGHFLVEATEFIAAFLVKEALTPGADAGGEADLLYWKRRVAQSCIYGVDLNPLAVELAKLSLWLTTVAQDRPLSFLDHHLRTGNALVGARLADLQLGGKPKAKKKAKSDKQEAAGQLSMMADDTFRQSMSLAVGNMWLIGETEANKVADVKKQEEIYAALRETFTRKWGRLADLVTATHFGVVIDHFLWKPLAAYAKGEAVSAPPKFSEWMDAVDAQAQMFRFFHWELEFPEVFFDRFGKPLGDKAGFDVVIGNPPYINAIELTKSLSEYEKQFWKKQFVSAEGAYDIYVLFIEQALNFVRRKGLVGLITPNKYLAAPYALGLRRYLIANHTLLTFRDLSRIAVFDEASVYPIISLIREGRGSTAYSVLVEQVSSTHESVFQHSSKLLSTLPDVIWGFLLTEGIGLISKIVKNSKTLNNAAQVNASTTTAEADNYSAILEDVTTPDIQTWKIINTGLIDRYAVTWGLEGMTHQHKNYQHPVLPKQASVVSKNRRHQYSQSKLIFSKMGLGIEAFIDTAGEYASMNTNFAIGQGDKNDLLFLGAVCNSTLLSWVYEQYFGALKMSGGYYQFQAPQLKALPISNVRFVTALEQREALLRQSIALYENRGYQALLVDVQAWVEAKQSDVVHDVLAHLAQQMLDLHKERQENVSSFLLDLEGILSEVALQKIGRLWTPPSEPKEDNAEKQATYAKTLAEAKAQIGELASRRLELRDHVGVINEAQWKWLLKRRLKKIDSLADLVKVFQKRQPAIAALDKRIGETDGLIDQIVYALYELTADEVKVVEAGTKYGYGAV